MKHKILFAVARSLYGMALLVKGICEKQYNYTKINITTNYLFCSNN